jgi:hypothetical protein
MTKYNSLKILKKVKAKTNHICSKCGQEIIQNDIYYKEHIQDKFLHSLHAKNIVHLAIKNTETLY